MGDGPTIIIFLFVIKFASVASLISNLIYILRAGLNDLVQQKVFRKLEFISILSNTIGKPASIII